jgi:DNA polymerase IV (DinB-like DNA polymerase)
MAAERLPGAPEGEDRIVCHVDMDCFYAACERLKEPELADEPVVVGMGYEDGETHGAVATASYEAREHGLESAMAISEALELLPRAGDADAETDAVGHYRPVDMEFYESVSEDVREILHDCADVVREVSIDEAYLDVTERTDWTVAAGFGRWIRDRIRRDVGVVASVGVAPNMSAAKIASDHDKPDGLVVVPPEELRDFLAPLPVEELHGVGPVTAGELRGMGLGTAGDVAETAPGELVDRFGEQGRTLRRRARGEDDREVTPRGRPKSLSRESAFTEAVAETAPKREKVQRLAAAVADRARRKGATYRTIGVKAVLPPFDVNTRERSLPGPVDDPDLLESVALDLFAEFDDERVRKVGVRVSNLSFAAGDQATLDGEWESAEGDDASAAEDLVDGQVTLDALGTDQGTSDDGDALDTGDDQSSLTDF